MNNKYMTEAELQHIEHCNKVLLEHKEIMQGVMNTTEAALNEYVPILQSYVNEIVNVRKLFGEQVVHIIQSTRELKVVSSNTQNLMDFCAAVNKLDALLTPSMIDKLQRIIK